MNLGNIFPAFSTDDSADSPASSVGTVDQPIFLSLADHPRALTGRAAHRSQQDLRTRIRLEGDTEAVKDLPIWTETRGWRRAQAAAAKRSQRKAQRGYVTRQLAQEQEINTLAALFATVNRKNPGKKKLSPTALRAKIRAKVAIDTRVKSLVDQDQARYDREMAARRRDRSLPAPAKPTGHATYLTQLAALASTAPTVVSGSAAVKAARAVNPRRHVVEAETGRVVA